jgi:rhomboid protease GluP
MSGRRTPVTLALLIAVGVCFAAQYLTGLRDGPLVQLGVNYGPAVFAGQYWRLVTSMFLHGDLIHLAFNGFALYQLGSLFELLLGSSRMLLVYFVAGVAGSLASDFFTRAPSLGASGAIFGLLGALIAFLLRRRGALTPAGKSILMQLVGWAAINVFLGFGSNAVGSGGPHIDNSAHLGGGAAGLLLGFLLPERPPALPARDYGGGL